MFTYKREYQIIRFVYIYINISNDTVMSDEASVPLISSIYMTEPSLCLSRNLNKITKQKHINMEIIM